MSRTLEQQRAAYALRKTNLQKAKLDDKSGDENVQKKRTRSVEDYARQVRKLPAMILNNGLGQALAFLLSNGNAKDKGSQALYNDLQTWLCGSKEEADYPLRVYSGAELIDQLINGSRTQYLLAQQEALRLLSWLKKFVDAYLPKADGGN